MVSVSSFSIPEAFHARCYHVLTVNNLDSCRVFTIPRLWTGLNFGLDYEITALLNYSGSDQCLSFYLNNNWQSDFSFSGGHIYLNNR